MTDDVAIRVEAVDERHATREDVVESCRGRVDAGEDRGHGKAGLDATIRILTEVRRDPQRAGADVVLARVEPDNAVVIRVDGGPRAEAEGIRAAERDAEPGVDRVDRGPGENGAQIRRLVEAQVERTRQRPRE